MVKKTKPVGAEAAKAKPAWFPLIAAAKAGDRAEVERLLDQGMAVSTTDDGGQRYMTDQPMSVLDHALANRHWELGGQLLTRGAEPNWRTLTVLHADVPDDLLKRLITSELPLDEDSAEAMLLDVALVEPEREPRATLVRKLAKLGLTLSTKTLHAMLASLRNENIDDDGSIRDAIDLHAELGTLDVNASGEDHASLLDVALETFSLPVLQRVVELGATLTPGRRVAKSWRDAAAKREWLAARAAPSAGKRGGPATLAEFAKFADDLLDADTVVAQLVSDTEVFPNRAAWLAARSWEKDGSDGGASHQFEKSDDGALHYEIRFVQEGSDDAYVARRKELYKKLSAALTAIYGKPIGKLRNGMVWSSGAQLSWGESGDEDSGAGYESVSVEWFPG